MNSFVVHDRFHFFIYNNSNTSEELLSTFLLSIRFMNILLETVKGQFIVWPTGESHRLEKKNWISFSTMIFFRAVWLYQWKRHKSKILFFIQDLDDACSCIHFFECLSFRSHSSCFQLNYFNSYFSLSVPRFGHAFFNYFFFLYVLGL